MCPGDPHPEFVVTKNSGTRVTRRLQLFVIIYHVEACRNGFRPPVPKLRKFLLMGISEEEKSYDNETVLGLSSLHIETKFF